MSARTGTIFRAWLGRGAVVLALLASIGLIASSASAGTMAPSGAAAAHVALYYPLVADSVTSSQPCNCQAEKQLIDLVQRFQGESHEQVAILSYYGDQVAIAKQKLQQAWEEQSRILSNNFASGAAIAGR